VLCYCFVQLSPLCALLLLCSVGQSFQAAAGHRPGVKPHAELRPGGRRNRLPHLTFITFGEPTGPCGTPLKATAPSLWSRLSRASVGAGLSKNETASPLSVIATKYVRSQNSNIALSTTVTEPRPKGAVPFYAARVLM
jgi:hypothetical protein